MSFYPKPNLIARIEGLTQQRDFLQESNRLLAQRIAELEAHPTVAVIEALIAVIKSSITTLESIYETSDRIDGRIVEVIDNLETALTPRR